MGDTIPDGGDPEVREAQEAEVLDREAFEEDLMAGEASEAGEHVSHVD